MFPTKLRKPSFFFLNNKLASKYQVQKPRIDRHLLYCTNGVEISVSVITSNNPLYSGPGSAMPYAPPTGLKECSTPCTRFYKVYLNGAAASTSAKGSGGALIQLFYDANGLSQLLIDLCLPIRMLLTSMISLALSTLYLESISRLATLTLPLSTFYLRYTTC
jgi:hypothetical protein